MVIYDRYDIVFQEIPDEISIAFTLKGCPNMCEGCHSPHLRELEGNELTHKEFKNIISKYKNQATVILFFGGDSVHCELIPLIMTAKNMGFKTAIYSGLNEFKFSLLNIVDYYKAGSYKHKLGGLDSKITNQRLIKIDNGKFEDITYKFWR